MRNIDKLPLVNVGKNANKKLVFGTPEWMQQELVKKMKISCKVSGLLQFFDWKNYSNIVLFTIGFVKSLRKYSSVKLLFPISSILNTRQYAHTSPLFIAPMCVH
eukprot:maker-scaffold_28-snap-gene-0.30-mRNA-1 protein AED:0.32 eAED:0.54 QI:0/0/0.33/1/0/0/3/253/103